MDDVFNDTYRVFSPANYVVNLYPYDVEIVYYKKGFNHLVDCGNLEDIDRERLLEKNDRGIYVPLRDDFTVSDLQRSIRNSSKRALDSFYGYAKSNDWEYFVTLTFSPEIVNRYDFNAVGELYSEFQRWCKRKNPDVKMLIVPEFHKKENENYEKALHFHGLISGISFKIRPFNDPHTNKPVYTKNGDPLFEILDWKYGLATLAIIPPDDNYNRVVSYLQKYVTKEGNIGYCKKRYYRTRNLDFKNKYIGYADDETLQDMLQDFQLEKYKENSKMIVYRRKQK